MKIQMTPHAFWHLQWMAQRTDCDPVYGGFATWVLCGACDEVRPEG